ncbi:signal peptide peptidase SppA [Novosphingobium sp. JCM 18896]|uniref:signal peptide peptidase SppA n=1 Tax=Novosphingobium sp. JCM 18896 TaxID=2989731 RepID=UPI00222178AF|nr:signal peptide peptidase SppA [Novosphingobium sp. JCM 18896]MCW1427685.1 signal peptide peptidase SppA [Novosphingobium sp. JCM 18896]
MAFARKVWKLLVAIKDGLALLFLILFFLAIYAALTSRPNIGQVQNGALLLKLDGAIVEEPSISDPIEQLVSRRAPTGEYRARDVVRALRLAAKDDRIKAVVFDLSRFTGAGFVHLHDIGQAMDEVRAAKKPILTYATLYADDGMLIAAHSSEVWVNPLGGALVLGPGGNQLFYGGLLERLKITAHVFRVGTYKSAVEPYIRNDMSPESRDAAQALYGALWENWKADVAKARPKANLALVGSDPVGWVRASGGDVAKAALAAGLVDKLGNEVEFGQRVAQVVGQNKLDPGPGHFAHTTLKTWLAANKPQRPGKAIGVVTIAGEIVDGDAGPGTAGGERIAKLLDEAQQKDFAALVVRVDSPGGTITGAEQIRAAIDRYKAKKIPIVVSMANLAASGGYWVSTPAQRIFAEPGTITGSIGVFAVIPSFERALSEWGVSADGVKTTPLSGQPDPIGGLSADVSAMLQANVESNYGRFIGLVGAARRKTPEQVDAIGQGRVWDGGTARQNGLVDEFGGLDEALAYAAKSAKLTEWHAVYLGDTPDQWASLLQRLGGQDDDSAPPAEARDFAAVLAQRQLGLVGHALAGAERLVGTRGVQAYCLECPAPGARQPVKGDLTLLARAAQMLELK